MSEILEMNVEGVHIVDVRLKMKLLIVDTAEHLLMNNLI
jgi:hypothetical protein